MLLKLLKRAPFILRKQIAAAAAAFYPTFLIYHFGQLYNIGENTFIFNS